MAIKGAPPTNSLRRTVTPARPSPIGAVWAGGIPPVDPPEGEEFIDDFSNGDLAPGAVDGSAASTATGSRRVVDTLLDVDITGGVLNLDGATTDPDPGIWWFKTGEPSNPIQVEPGQFFELEVGSDVNANFFLGLGSGVGIGPNATSPGTVALAGNNVTLHEYEPLRDLVLYTAGVTLPASLGLVYRSNAGQFVFLEDAADAGTYFMLCARQLKETKSLIGAPMVANRLVAASGVTLGLNKFRFAGPASGVWPDFSQLDYVDEEFRNGKTFTHRVDFKAVLHWTYATGNNSSYLNFREQDASNRIRINFSSVQNRIVVQKILLGAATSTTISDVAFHADQVNTLTLEDRDDSTIRICVNGVEIYNEVVTDLKGNTGGNYSGNFVTVSGQPCRCAVSPGNLNLGIAHEVIISPQADVEYGTYNIATGFFVAIRGIREYFGSTNTQSVLNFWPTPVPGDGYNIRVNPASGLIRMYEGTSLRKSSSSTFVPGDDVGFHIYGAGGQLYLNDEKLSTPWTTNVYQGDVIATGNPILDGRFSLDQVEIYPYTVPVAP